MVLVAKEGHKHIVIGKQGGLMKEAGKLARKELKLFLGKKVFLELWAGVRNWSKDVSMIERLGYAGT